MQIAAGETGRGRSDLEKAQGGDRGPQGPGPAAAAQSGWLNGGPLSWKQLRGKVVVLHFWEFNCGPCMNELPLMARWHERAAESGQVIIGIHPPTRDLDAVRKTLAKFGAKYPVLIDSPPTKQGGIGLLHDWFGALLLAVRRAGRQAGRRGGPRQLVGRRPRGASGPLVGGRSAEGERKTIAAAVTPAALPPAAHDWEMRAVAGQVWLTLVAVALT